MAWYKTAWYKVTVTNRWGDKSEFHVELEHPYDYNENELLNAIWWNYNSLQPLGVDTTLVYEPVDRPSKEWVENQLEQARKKVEDDKKNLAVLKKKYEKYLQSELPVSMGPPVVFKQEFSIRK